MLDSAAVHKRMVGALLSATLASYSGTNLSQSLSASKNALSSYISGKTSAESFRNGLAINSGVGRKKGTILTDEEKALYLSWGYDELDLIPEYLGGNSPENGGVISSTADNDGWWTEREIQEAQNAFAGGNRFLFTSVSSGEGILLCPDVASVELRYTPQAWGLNSSTAGDEANADRDIYAQGIYNRSNFKECGFLVYDSLGFGVNTGVTRSVTVDRLALASAMINVLSDSALAGQETNTLIENASGVITTLSGIPIRPNTYYIEYKYSKDSTELSFTRRIIVVWNEGDVDLSGAINSGDSTYAANYYAKRVKPYSGLTGADKTIIQGLHTYRIMDVDQSGAINSGDTTRIKNIYAKRTNANIYYPAL